MALYLRSYWLTESDSTGFVLLILWVSGTTAFFNTYLCTGATYFLHCHNNTGRRLDQCLHIASKSWSTSTILDQKCLKPDTCESKRSSSLSVSVVFCLLLSLYGSAIPDLVLYENQLTNRAFIKSLLDCLTFVDNCYTQWLPGSASNAKSIPGIK